MKKLKKAIRKAKAKETLRHVRGGGLSIGKKGVSVRNVETVRAMEANERDRQNSKRRPRKTAVPKKYQ